ncbi:unnamed protein product [Caenorhabditis nigoni]
MDDPRKKLTKAEKKAKYRTDYPEPIKTRREDLKAIMNGRPEDRERKARSRMRQFFEEDYNSNVNIYGMAVDMMMAMPDRTKTGGENLAHWYLEDFGKWLTETGREEYLRGKYLTSSVQLEALKSCLAEQKSLVSQIFDISPEKLLEDVTQLLRDSIVKREYSKAAKLAVQHNLSNTLDFKELALPLILSGKNREAYQLMASDVEMQKDYVQFLDEMIGLSQTGVEEILEPYKSSRIMTIGLENFCGKTVEKQIQQVLSKVSHEFNFDKDLPKYAPKHSVRASLKALQYSIQQRYNGIDDNGDDNYFQTMVDTMQQDPNVQEKILFYLWDSNIHEKQVDAICIAIHLKINYPSSQHLPGKMKDFFREPDSRLKEAERLLQKRLTVCAPEEGEQMYVFEDEKCPIYMIKTESEMQSTCEEIESLNREPEKSVYVGFDSEWKPSNLITANASKIAIIQLFFKDKVLLVDCVELEKEKVPDLLWERFAKGLFETPKLKLIGFDMRNDLEAIIELPALKGRLRLEQIKNAYDLKRLAENICDIDMDILELPKKTFKLADLTQYLLGQVLDKTEQCSNWQCRPLRKKQILYAALDAVVVVNTFKKILEKTQERNEDVDVPSVVKNSNVLAPKKERDQKVMRKLKTIPWTEIYETLRGHRDTSMPLQRPHEIQVIVDTMLLGFGKHLRRVGIDVYLPRDVSDFKAKLRVINRLGGEYQRHIITVPSKSYNALRVDYESNLMAIPELNHKAPLDQLIDFFDRFNVDLRPEDEFLRCIECNSRLQIKFPGPVLHFLHQYAVIHVQNVYRADMSEFPLEEWWNRMLRINPDDYDGIKVEMSRPNPKSKWMVATVPTGCLHITRQTAIHNNLPDGVEVRIHKVPDDEFQRPNLCFYVCGDCGTVGYDGRAPTESNSYESMH